MAKFVYVPTPTATPTVSSSRSCGMDFWLSVNRTRVTPSQIERVFQLLGLRAPEEYWLSDILRREHIQPLAFLFAVRQIITLGKTVEKALAWWRRHYQGYLGRGTIVVQLVFKELDMTFYGLATVPDAAKRRTELPGDVPEKLRIDCTQTDWVPNKRLFIKVEQKKPSTVLRIFRRSRNKVTEETFVLPQHEFANVNEEATWTLEGRNWPNHAERDTWTFGNHKSETYRASLVIDWARTAWFHRRLPLREFMFAMLPRDLVNLVVDDYLDGSLFERGLETRANRKVTYSIDHKLSLVD